jgi:hypothetical protein
LQKPRSLRHKDYSLSTKQKGHRKINSLCPFVFADLKTYWGRPPLVFLPLGTGVLPPPGGTALMFNGGSPIAFLIVAGSGIPGVGVRPGFTPFLISSGPGMPGVGVVPFGKAAAFAGMPGTLLTGSGLPESPGGMFAGSSLIIFAFEVTEFELEFAFEVAFEPHAVSKAAANSDNVKILIINKPLVMCFKIAVPV